MNTSSKPRIISIADKLPPTNERVMIVCKGFRCLGFLDRTRIWRDANGLTELKNVLGWYRLGDN
jgi:hypothetical protein